MISHLRPGETQIKMFDVNNYIALYASQLRISGIDRYPSLTIRGSDFTGGLEQLLSYIS